MRQGDQMVWEKSCRMFIKKVALKLLKEFSLEKLNIFPSFKIANNLGQTNVLIDFKKLPKLQ